MRNHHLAIPKDIQLLNKKYEVKQLAKHYLLKPANLKPGSFTNVYMDQIFNLDILFLKDSVLVMNEYWKIIDGEKRHTVGLDLSYLSEFKILDIQLNLHRILLSESADRITKIHYFLYHIRCSDKFSLEDFVDIIYQAEEVSKYYKEHGKKLILYICKYQYQCIKDYIEKNPKFKKIWESLHISIDEGVVFVKGSMYYYFTTGNVLYSGELYNVRNMGVKL
jgi:hypothetical protein